MSELARVNATVSALATSPLGRVLPGGLICQKSQCQRCEAKCARAAARMLECTRTETDRVLGVALRIGVCLGHPAEEVAEHLGVGFALGARESVGRQANGKKSRRTSTRRSSADENEYW